MNRYLVAIVIAILLFGVAFILGQRRATVRANKRVDVNVVLEQSNTQCRAADPLPFRAQHGDTITWHVTNNCTSAYFVQFKNFGRKNDNGSTGNPEADVVDKEPVSRTAIAANGGTDTLPATVTKVINSGSVFYKYEIWLGTTAANLAVNRDPEIEIYY